MNKMMMVVGLAALTGCATTCNCGCKNCGESKSPAICTPEEIAEGFVPLFNGTDLTGWTPTGSQTAYKAIGNGILEYDEREGGANLWTDRDYADFVIRFEFKLSYDCNNGLAVRTPFGRHAAQDGMEVQMLHDEGNMYIGSNPQLGSYTRPYQRHGSVYGVIPAKTRPDGKSYLNRAGEWNTEEVTVVGSKIKVVLNGTVILEDDLSKYPTDGTTPDHQKHPGLRNATGRLGWLSHGYPCWWRRVRVKEIK